MSGILNICQFTLWRRTILQIVSNCKTILQIVSNCKTILQIVSNCKTILQIVSNCKTILQIVSNCKTILQIVSKPFCKPEKVQTAFWLLLRDARFFQKQIIQKPGFLQKPGFCSFKIFLSTENKKRLLL